MIDGIRRDSILIRILFMLLKVRALESLFLLSLYNISQKLTKKLKSIFKNEIILGFGYFTILY